MHSFSKCSSKSSAGGCSSNNHEDSAILGSSWDDSERSENPRWIFDVQADEILRQRDLTFRFVVDSAFYVHEKGWLVVDWNLITPSRITRAAHLWHALQHGLHHPNKDHRHFFSQRSEVVQFRSCPTPVPAEREEFHAKCRSCTLSFNIRSRLAWGMVCRGVPAELQNHVWPQCSGRFQRLSDTQTTCRVGIARYSWRNS